jgi:ABC-2 type transport system ATP-binding protein
VIDIRGLTRAFGQRLAVEDLHLTIPSGQICVLLGPNGAGKTTTVRVLMGFVAPTRGAATVAGVEVPGPASQLAALRVRVGLLTETPGFYDRLDALENLTLFGRLYGIEPRRLATRIEELLTALDLWDRRHDLVATYSKGMKQKLAVARAVFHDPEVIFFDEPTAGLDPESARAVREMILGLKRTGRTMIVCTHNLAEGAAMADVVAVLQSRLIAFGSIDDITGASTSTRCTITLGAAAESAVAVVATVQGVVRVVAEGATLQVQADAARRRAPAIVAALVQAGFEIVEVRLVEKTLEEFYLEAVGAGT